MEANNHTNLIRSSRYNVLHIMKHRSRDLGGLVPFLRVDWQLVLTSLRDGERIGANWSLALTQSRTMYSYCVVKSHILQQVTLLFAELYGSRLRSRETSMVEGSSSHQWEPKTAVVGWAHS